MVEIRCFVSRDGRWCPAVAPSESDPPVWYGPWCPTLSGALLAARDEARRRWPGEGCRNVMVQLWDVRAMTAAAQQLGGEGQPDA